MFVVFDVILATERLTLGRNSKYGSVVSSTPDGRIEKSLKPTSNPTRGSGGASHGAIRGGGAGGASRGGRRGGGAGGAGRVTIKGRLDKLEETVKTLAETLTTQHEAIRTLVGTVTTQHEALFREVKRVEYLINQSSATESQHENVFGCLEVCGFDFLLLDLCFYIYWIQYTGTVTLQQY